MRKITKKPTFYWRDFREVTPEYKRVCAIANRKAEQLRKQNRELEKKLFSLEQKHDGFMSDLIDGLFSDD